LWSLLAIGRNDLLCRSVEQRGSLSLLLNELLRLSNTLWSGCERKSRIIFILEGFLLSVTTVIESSSSPIMCLNFPMMLLSLVSRRIVLSDLVSSLLGIGHHFRRDVLAVNMEFPRPLLVDTSHLLLHRYSSPITADWLPAASAPQSSSVSGPPQTRWAASDSQTQRDCTESQAPDRQVRLLV
ncbi:hypothetical protein XENOCAPTIV_028729, partial [Xenoophorus captivus]